MIPYGRPSTTLAQDLFHLVLKVSRQFLDKLLSFLIETGVIVDKAIKKLDRMLVDKQPTFAQYANRLIEYIDIQFITEAYNRFEDLVRAGVDPDHAFLLVVTREG